MYELYTQAAILVLSSGFRDNNNNLLLSLKEIRSNWQVFPRAFSEKKLLMNPYMFYNLWTHSALLPLPQPLGPWYPRVASLGTKPGLKAGCCLQQFHGWCQMMSSVFKSGKRWSGQAFTVLFKSHIFFLFFKLMKNILTGLCPRQLFI